MFLISVLNFRRLASTFVDIAAHMKQLNDSKQFQKAIALFDAHIQQEQPTTVVIDQALKACIESGHLKRGLNIHESLSSSLVKNVFIQNRLIRLYMKYGDVVKAREIFQTSTNQTMPMYTSMLHGLADNNHVEEALDLFRRMTNPPNEYTFSILFKICAQLGDHQSLEFGKKIFETMPVKFQNDIIILNSALRMFIKCGDISSSKQLFARMKKNMITYGIMMAGFLTNKLPQQAIDLFYKIEKPDRVLFCIFFNACAQLGTTEALILGKQMFAKLPVQYHQTTDILYSISNMFIKCDDIKSAESLFTRLNRDVICYGSLMKMYTMKNEPEKTLTLFKQMKHEKIEPNEKIFVLAIDACSEMGDLTLCESIISQIPLRSLTNSWIQNATIDMWGKSGSAEEAKRVFDTIEKPSSVSFSAMINAYGLNGMGLQAVELFRQIPLDMLNSWIYVCVLNACSHSGLIDEAREIFDKIPINMRTNQIYTTIVDALSRSYLFDEAEQLIHEFEQNSPPYIPMYMAVLSGARNQKNPLLSQKIFDRIQLLFPDMKSCLTSATVLLANTYASDGHFSKASDIRMEIRRMGGKKKIGLSQTVVNGQVVKFRAHDQSHPCSTDISAESDRLTKELIEHGYISDSSWITRAMENDETTESIFCGHSERLAISYNLIQRPIPTRIQVVKNLRVCGDCHTAIKLIARIRQCLIIIRDTNRVHHFHPNGHCSCGDRF